MVRGVGLDAVAERGEDGHDAAEACGLLDVISAAQERHQEGCDGVGLELRKDRVV